ncbi:T9SS type A sorting domain-containing protein [Parvicella tangerina]|uniref:T9SS C-terminal target domain-containing protein n=1 Tax=Parvicella tangerina TaxID=2829795 RepID=A0A916JPQ7_9FLAO|nr:T9SS type A sorting domain-containing protein [Parvicella tangerina]CAG5086166.1 hypothetical protein CRYO30217_03030 [Parvicella tangerina]
MRLVTTIGLTLVLFGICAQNNALILNNNPFLVVNGGTAGDEAVMVVNQSHEDGIITMGTGGNIITHGEFDYIKWNIGTSTGAYTVPFTADADNNKLPLTVNITGAGTGSGYIAFSSWDVSTGPGQFDNLGYPSEVTHMAGANGSADNSEYAVDRFWVIDVDDPLGTGETYSAIPTPNLTFGYNTSAAETADGNVLTVGNLGAQYFDPVGENWHGASSGASATGIWGADNGAGLVSGVTPPSWYRTWTLADFSSPLPVELNFFDAACKDEGVVLSWQTASEINSSHFEIYKSLDGINFELAGTIPSHGNSSVNVDYSFVDEVVNSSEAIYKLIQYDNDGTFEEMAIVSEGACYSDAGLNVFGDMNGDVVVSWNASEEGEYQVVLFDALGKQVSAPKLLFVEKGFNRFDLSYDQLAFGNYLIQISNESSSFVKKLVIR